MAGRQFAGGSSVLGPPTKVVTDHRQRCRKSWRASYILCFSKAFLAFWLKTRAVKRDNFWKFVAATSMTACDLLASDVRYISSVLTDLGQPVLPVLIHDCAGLQLHIYVPVAQLLPEMGTSQQPSFVHAGGASCTPQAISLTIYDLL